MPVDDPQFGEVWTTTDVASGRIMQGIVADVSPTRVMFVSLVGNRVAVPLSRLRTNWNFVQPTPRRLMPECERVGCTSMGMIEYLRAQRREYACPKHAPSGVQCRITANYEAPVEPRKPRPGFECRSTPCPTCGERDPAEDVRIAAYPARLWFCPACNNRWATIPRILDEEQDIEQAAYMVRHELNRLQYEVDSILILNPLTWDNLLRNANTITPPVVEAVRSAALRDMQFFLETTAVTEQVREHFYAIARVRTTNIHQAERPVQRLGGSPNRGGVIGSSLNPVRPAPGPQDPLVYRPPGNTVEQAQAAVLRRVIQESPGRELFDSSANPETPVPDVEVEKENVWVQRASGDLMIVLDIIKATDGTDAIQFRRSSAEDIEPAVVMTKRDFIINHRRYTPTSSEEPAKAPKPMIEVSVDQEWECQDGSAMIVTQVDHKREIIFGDDLKTKKHRQIPFTQFATGRWRRIIRRSIYDRIRHPELNLAPGQKDE